MFKTIIQNILQNNIFQNKGIYLENKQNHWLNAIPKDKESVIIQWKNGGFKKKHFIVKKEEETELMFEEWKEEIKKNGIENNILKIFCNNPEYFKKKLIFGQKYFKINIRKFETKFVEKLKESNEEFNKERSLRHVRAYFLIKQFGLKIKINDFKIINPFKQEIILFKKNNFTTVIKTPLEFKLVLEEKLLEDEKKALKKEFLKRAKDNLKDKTDLEYTGIKRIFEKYQI